MTTETPDLKAVAERLDKLEKRLRIWRWFMVAFFLLATGLAAVGFMKTAKCKESVDVLRTQLTVLRMEAQDSELPGIHKGPRR